MCSKPGFLFLSLLPWFLLCFTSTLSVLTGTLLTGCSCPGTWFPACRPPSPPLHLGCGVFSTTSAWCGAGIFAAACSGTYVFPAANGVLRLEIRTHRRLVVWPDSTLAGGQVVVLYPCLVKSHPNIQILGAYVCFIPQYDGKSKIAPECEFFSPSGILRMK